MSLLDLRNELAAEKAAFNYSNPLVQAQRVETLEAAVIALIDHVLDAGTPVDAAPVETAPAVEEVVGDTLEARTEAP